MVDGTRKGRKKKYIVENLEKEKEMEKEQMEESLKEEMEGGTLVCSKRRTGIINQLLMTAGKTWVPGDRKEMNKVRMSEQKQESLNGWIQWRKESDNGLRKPLKVIYEQMEPDIMY